MKEPLLDPLDPLQGKPLSAPLFHYCFHFNTNNSSFSDPSVNLLKFIGDTTMVSLISNNDQQSLQQTRKVYNKPHGLMVRME